MNGVHKEVAVISFVTNGTNLQVYYKSTKCKNPLIGKV